MDDYRPRNAGCFVSPCKLLENYAQNNGLDCKITMIGCRFLFKNESKDGSIFKWKLLGRDFESAKDKLDKIKDSTLTLKEKN